MIDEKMLIKAITKGEYTTGNILADMELQQFIKDFPKIGEWIPCSERLPDHEGRYLTTCRENRIAQIRIYEGNGFWDSINEVIAWQPLPEPYKE